MAVYRTKHREKLLEFFSNNKKKSFTAAGLHQRMEEEGYKMGIATLYRQLASLYREGYLGSIQEEGQADSYFYVGNPGQCILHYHLKCLDCGRLHHLECQIMEAMEEHVRVHHNFIIDREESVLYGRCASCRERI